MNVDNKGVDANSENNYPLLYPKILWTVSNRVGRPRTGHLFSGKPKIVETGHVDSIRGILGQRSDGLTTPLMPKTKPSTLPALHRISSQEMGSAHSVADECTESNGV